MFCTNCGKKLNNNDNFCRNCGNKITNKNTKDENTQSIDLKENSIEIKESSEDITKENLENEDEYYFDISIFGNDSVEACKYVRKKYNVDIIKAKEIVDKKYKELEEMKSDIQKLFSCTSQVGPIQIYAENRLFKISGTKTKPIPKVKKKRGLFSNLAAVSTLGMTRALENATDKLVELMEDVSENIYGFDEISSFEILENNNVVTTGGFGTATVSTLLTGSYAAGALGALVAKKTSTSEVISLAIKINLKSLTNPSIYIPLIKSPVMSNSSKYQNAYNDAHQILSTLNSLKYN